MIDGHKIYLQFIKSTMAFSSLNDIAHVYYCQNHSTPPGARAALISTEVPAISGNFCCHGLFMLSPLPSLN